MNVNVAKLDADGVYWGIEQKPLAEVTAADVVFDAETFARDIDAPGFFIAGGCDNPPGRYRWNAEMRQFVPLKGREVRELPSPPSLERAFYALVAALETSGTALPAPVAAWVSWYSQTFDVMTPR